VLILSSDTIIVNQNSDEINVLDLNRPLIPTGVHPIETGQYLIPTNSILNMFKEVCRWINYRIPGGIIYGRPRLGKTRAIKYLVHVLPQEYGESMPIFHIKSLHSKMANESAFFETLLKDVGHGLPFSGKPGVKRDRLFKFLWEIGNSSKQKRIVMFIDEAQCLHDLQYGWLMDIFNELDQAGVSMTFILVGQEQLVHQRSAYIQSRKDQIIGRFMVQDYRFKGIKTVDDIRVCLNCFDEISEYPENSGCSFTQYYFPKAFACGDRLEDFADDLFDLFTTFNREAKLSSSIEIPMQYLMTTMEFALREYGVGGGEQVRWLNKALWKNAIQYSGYINAEVRIPQVMNQ
jgi:hypothetical protein